MVVVDADDGGGFWMPIVANASCRPRADESISRSTSTVMVIGQDGVTKGTLALFARCQSGFETRQ